MGRRLLLVVGLGWSMLTSGLSWSAAQDPQPAPAVPSTPAVPQVAQAPRAPGAKVTFTRVGEPVTHSQVARLLSLAVERGETASPFVPPGLFRASYEAFLVLPARDRCNFRIDGRGSVKLSINGEVVLEGVLRPGKPLSTAQPARLKKGDNELHVQFESAAQGEGQFRLFWSGSDFGFEPIAPERLTHAPDAAVEHGELARQGQQLFTERRCARCHEFQTQRIGESAFAELDDSGPDLRTVGARANAGWIAAWLRDPRQFRPDATMPALALSPQDCDDLAAFLAGLGAPAAAPQLTPELAANGEVRFRQLGCVACHVAPAEPPAAAALGSRIHLGFVPQKWQPQALVEFLQNPAKDFPHVRMPNLRLSHDEAMQLAAFLLARAQPQLPGGRGDAGRGKKLAHTHNCALCHALDVAIDERRYPRLRNVKPERGCLHAQPHDHKAPAHGFADAQRAALRAFLPFAEQAPFRRAPIDFVQRHLTADRCTACHALDGRPSVWAQVAASSSEPLPKDQDPIAQGVPSLTWVGSKLQPSWLDRFVTGKEKSPRPWLTARMPAFAQHGSVLVGGLVREHGYGPQEEPPAAMDAELIQHGQSLVAQGTGFFCVQCHALGDQPAVQVFEREGIELLTARGRLRHEYFTRWLADPPRLDPDSRMPKYATAGKTAFTGVLGGDAAQQFEAIWQFLGSRRPQR